VASLILTAGLGNTSFVGLPAIRLLVGESGVGPAILFDQLGSFLSLAIGGAMVVAWGRGEGVVWGTAIRKFVLFPPTLALLLAVGLRGVELGSFWLQVLGWVSQTLSPAALFAVGLAAVMPRPGHAKQLGAGLAWKLVLAPLGVLGIAAGMGSDPGWTQVAVLQAGMAPMVTGGILAASADLEPELASQMVMIGLFVSGLSLPVWNLMF
jgi:predicted permease